MPHVPILLQSAPIDISGIGQSIVNAIQGAMPQLATSAAQASVPAIQSTAPVLATSAGQSVTTGGSGLIDALQSNPLNVLTQHAAGADLRQRRRAAAPGSHSHRGARRGVRRPAA